jgi:hypothetical protein
MVRRHDRPPHVRGDVSEADREDDHEGDDDAHGAEQEAT